MEGLSQRHYLTPLFEPGSVAIIGASEQAGSVGAVLMSNMLASKYRGALHAVNPKYRSVQGVPCFEAIGKVPQRVDLAVIATPAPSVPGIIAAVRRCRRACRGGDQRRLPPHMVTIPPDSQSPGLQDKRQWGTHTVAEGSRTKTEKPQAEPRQPMPSATLP